jgi:hypothetical protein
MAFRVLTLKTFRSFSSKLSKDSIYFEAIRDIRSLDTYTRDLVLNQTYSISLTSLIAFSFDQYVNLCLDPSKKEVRFVLMKERRFNSLIGYSFYPVHEFYLKENDKSKENQYLVTLFYNLLILPHFRDHTGLKMYDLSNLLLKKDYPETNRLSFNTTMNSIFYEHRLKLTSFITPDPRRPPNEKLDGLMDKLIQDLGHKRHSPEHPLVRVYPNAYLVGYDKQRLEKLSEKGSDLCKFFYKTINCNPDWTMFNLAVYNLVPGNTLGLEAGEHGKMTAPDFDVFEFGTNKPIKI